MEIEEWKKIHADLKRCYSMFNSVYRDIEGDKNKQATANAERIALMSCDIIKKNAEVFSLLVSDDFEDYIVWDEFKQLRYFSRDMSELLKKIEDKITSLEQIKTNIEEESTLLEQEENNKKRVKQLLEQNLSFEAIAKKTNLDIEEIKIFVDSLQKKDL